MHDTVRTHASDSGGMVVLRNVALILTVVGGLNWGLVGAFGFDLVAAIFGPMSTSARVVYVLVGVASIVSLLNLRGRRGH